MLSKQKSNSTYQNQTAANGAGTIGFGAGGDGGGSCVVAAISHTLWAASARRGREPGHGGRSGCVGGRHTLFGADGQRRAVRAGGLLFGVGTKRIVCAAYDRWAWLYGAGRHDFWQMAPRGRAVGVFAVWLFRRSGHSAARRGDNRLGRGASAVDPSAALLDDGNFASWLHRQSRGPARAGLALYQVSVGLPAFLVKLRRYLISLIRERPYQLEVNNLV